MTWLSTLTSVSIFLVGLINLLPVIGVLGGERLASAYGITIDGPDLEILLRHRALLFGIIGGFVLTSLWLPDLRMAALALAGISMAGFLCVHWIVGDAGRELGRIAVIDLVGMVFLSIALVSHYAQPGS